MVIRARCRPTMAMQLTPKSVTQIASAISAPLSGAADRRRYVGVPIENPYDIQ